MRKEKNYTLLVNGKRISVTEEVYRIYYREKEHEKYMDKLARKKEISFDAYEENGIHIDSLLSDRQESIEDKLIKVEMTVKLSNALEKLPEQERYLICLLYFTGKSERELCATLDIAKTTLHDRKIRILKKLKKLLEL